MTVGHGLILNMLRGLLSDILMYILINYNVYIHTHTLVLISTRKIVKGIVWK